MTDAIEHLLKARAALLGRVLRVAAQSLDDAGIAALRAEILEVSAAGERRATAQGWALVQACELALSDLVLHRARR